ncbi:LOW QUALITY PROTEIN: cation channel sperm-associated protein 3-like [Polymixia lowei]
MEQNEEVKENKEKNWGDLRSAIFTLFSMMTVDSWRQSLDDLGMDSSRIFTIVFILIGYFILFNIYMMEDLCTSMSFTDLYLTSLDLQDHTMKRMHHLYNDIMSTVCERVEDLQAAVYSY